MASKWRTLHTNLTALLVFAGAVQTASAQAADVPVGTVMPFYGTKNQLIASGAGNYLICDGSQITKTQFPDLYSLLIGANPDLRVDQEVVRLPDLRGEFLRGFDDGRGVDKGRLLGKPQASQVERHDHQVPLSSCNDNGGTTVRAGNNCGSDTSRATSDAPSSKETRPRNVAVNFIIRALP